MTASENRRYIREVIMPSYNISDSWNNPHYTMWIDQVVGLISESVNTTNERQEE